MSLLTILFFVIGGILILFGVINLFKQNQQAGTINILGIEANGPVSIIIIVIGAAFFFIPIKYPDVFRSGLDATTNSNGQQKKLDSLAHAFKEYIEENNPLTPVADDQLDDHFDDFNQIDKLDDQAITVLENFALDLEDHDWESAIRHFSSEHVADQFQMFLDTFFDNINTENLRIEDLTPIYLCQSMNSMDLINCDEMDQIDRIYYTDLGDEHNANGSYTVQFVLVLENGAERSGWFWLDRVSGKIHGPYG